MMTRSTEDISNYYTEAKEAIPSDHPHYDEILELLSEQITDEYIDALNYTYYNSN